MHKKFYLTLFILLITVSIAQEDNGKFWVTASAGYPFDFMVGVGFEDIIGDMSLRVGAAVSNDGGVNLLLDALIKASSITQTPSFIAYGGLGAKANFKTEGLEKTSVYANLLVGIEHRFIEIDLENMGIFLELGPSFRLVPSFDTEFYARAGLNVHF